MSPIRKEKKQKNYLYKVKNFELTLQDCDHPEAKNQLVTDEDGATMHYMVKDKDNSKTHVSQIDDGFVEYRPESKFEANVGELIGNIVGKKRDEKKKKDESKLNNFLIYFDMSLYIAPPVVLKLEETFAAEEVKKNK
jgi:hypothetical protein